MKRVAFVLIIAVTFLAVKNVEAQRPTTRRNSYGNTSTQQQPPKNNYGTPDTSVKGSNANANNYGNNSSSVAIDTTLPITVIKGSGNGLLDSVKMSLRNDGAVERNLVKDRTPLAYEDIREDDAV